LNVGWPRRYPVYVGIAIYTAWEFGIWRAPSPWWGNRTSMKQPNPMLLSFLCCRTWCPWSETIDDHWSCYLFIVDFLSRSVACQWSSHDSQFRNELACLCINQIPIWKGGRRTSNPIGFSRQMWNWQEPWKLKFYFDEGRLTVCLPSHMWRRLVQSSYVVFPGRTLI
jgi:hypothetical protein